MSAAALDTALGPCIGSAVQVAGAVDRRALVELERAADRQAAVALEKAVGRSVMGPGTALVEEPDPDTRVDPDMWAALDMRVVPDMLVDLD